MKAEDCPYCRREVKIYNVGGEDCKMFAPVHIPRDGDIVEEIKEFSDGRKYKSITYNHLKCDDSFVARCFECISFKSPTMATRKWNRWARSERRRIEREKK